MVSLVPSILTASVDELQRYITIYSAFAKHFHLDIADGSFVNTMTVKLADITSLPDELVWDFHMMVIDPLLYIDDIVRLAPSLVIFHAEVGANLLEPINKLKEAGIKTGVALLQRTYPGDVSAYIEAADHVLIFAGELGKQGGTADLLQIEKIKLIKAINPSVEIGWDGGINIENVRAVAHSGLDILNIGRAIAMSTDPAATYKELSEESDRLGVRL